MVTLITLIGSLEEGPTQPKTRTGFADKGVAMAAPPTWF
jgi:hypothetical protein